MPITHRTILLVEDNPDDVELTLSSVATEIASFHPDFTINLGDTLDFHAFGFNDPPPEGRYTRLGYLN